jgi:DNA-binding MarR family transcriptional regulator
MSTRTGSSATERDRARVAELAGGLRTAVSRLAHVLRSPATEKGVTPTRLTALATLERHGALRPGDLATRMNITAASMSRLTEALEDGGWVTRDADPDDRRACLLRLSQHGLTTLEGLRRENDSELSNDIVSLSEHDRAALEAALPVLIALADRHLDPMPPAQRDS